MWFKAKFGDGTSVHWRELPDRCPSKLGWRVSASIDAATHWRRWKEWPDGERTADQPVWLVDGVSAALDTYAMLEAAAGVPSSG